MPWRLSVETKAWRLSVGLRRGTKAWRLIRRDYDVAWYTVTWHDVKCLQPWDNGGCNSRPRTFCCNCNFFFFSLAPLGRGFLSRWEKNIGSC
jgi:hypothetical protein